MKAMVYTEYGAPGVLHLQEVEKPVPKDDEVLIKVFATTATPSDVKMRSGKSFVGRIITGLRKPGGKYQILGTELAGEIEATGKSVTRFTKGDQVYGFRVLEPARMPNTNACLKRGRWRSNRPT